MPETSPVNQSKRMVKKQQMRWSPRGAHSRSAPGYSTTTLADDYRRWYPGFTHTDGRTRRRPPTVCPALVLDPDYPTPVHAPTGG